MTKTQKGVTLALVTSIFYGLMPFFSVPLQAEGVNHLSNLSILFYRNLLGSLPLALIMLWEHIPFRISLPELITLIVLAGFSDGAALFQIEGYPPLLPTGIATTIHFLYPVFTALIILIFRIGNAIPVPYVKKYHRSPFQDRGMELFLDFGNAIPRVSAEKRDIGGCHIIGNIQ